MKKLLLGCAFGALAASNAYAQSTGSVDFEKEIVVTGTKADTGVAGVAAPDTSKTRQVLTSEFIQHQVAGQSIDEIINMMPGVSFQNNDPYGASGGTLSIRGFDASRISQTVDGIPLNDTGNYAIYSNQQIDPELIDRVDVSLGSTDVDSPTASATGSTVNYRTVNPTKDFHVDLRGSVGEWKFLRIFGKIDTGEFGPWGTKAWISASRSSNDNPYNRSSGVDKKAYNAKIYQPVGSNGDFFAIAGNWNDNKNNNFSSGVLRVDQTILSSAGVVTAPRLVGTASTNRFPLTKAERFYNQGNCQVDTAQAGIADVPTTCGTAFDYSYNPSRTGNIRANSKWTLADGLVFTFDPSYQYVSANGGSSAVKANEGFFTRAGTGIAAITTPIYGYIGGQPYFGGVDLNGDGDKIDTPGKLATGALTNTTQGVELYAPSQTNTNRFIVISSLRYDISSSQTVRLNYTWDHGRHRQTGFVGTLAPNGYASEVFPRNSPLLDASGQPIQKRNRKSYAILNQVSGEYRGEFFDDKLTVNAGVRAPFFKRNLRNYCVSEAGGGIGFVDCFNDATSQATFLAANPTYAAPQQRIFKYHKVLPSAGATFDLTPHATIYANFSQGLQVPGTDNLYNSFAFAAGTARAKPSPETSDNFDVGVRYRSGKIQAQLAGWYTNYKNRLASAYDPELDVTIYRNLGTVHKYGVDASVAYQPIKQITAYAFGSYLKSKILDNVVSGECTSAQATAKTNGCVALGDPIYAPTAGKRESGSPTYTWGGRLEAELGPLQLGGQIKRTGPRYVNDINLPVVQTYTAGTPATTVSYQVYGAKAQGYTLVDLDARLSLAKLGFNDRTYLQLNVTNLFDKLFVAGYTGTLLNNSVRNAYIGSPRTVSGTVVIGF